MQESVKINRNHYIGGSDIPAIMGISKFKSRFELLRQKADLEEDTFTGNKYTEYGNTLEPKIREYLNRQWQEKFEESIYVKDPSDFDFPIRCHLDGESEKSVLEIKTTGEDLIDLVKNESDDVVLRSTFKIYLVQTLFYMMNADKKVGCIAVYFRPKDLNEEFDFSRLRCFWFNIKEYEDIVEEITNSIKKFVADVQKLMEVYLDLRDFFTEEELEQLAAQDRLIYAQQAGEEERWPIAVDISDIGFVTDNITSEGPIYFCLSGNTQRPEMCRDAWEYINSWKSQE